MKISILSIIGIILIMFEAWFPKKANELGETLARIHKISLTFFKMIRRITYNDYVYLPIILISIFFLFLGLILDQNFPDKGFLYLMLFGIGLAFILSIPIFISFWLIILMHLFHYFSYVTKGKPFMSIGILIAIFDVYSKEIISFIF